MTMRKVGDVHPKPIIHTAPPEQVRAKLRVESKSELAGGHRSINMRAVYSDDPASENRKFSDATPAAQFQITIKKDGPHDFFEVGGEYYLDFTKAV